ncbi:transmembrane protein 79-like [Ostrea edulis]|uniref:transmembrane protein 79-like n=1 Tax=Ostrea edulis TaxID=37623 RepID=UPI0024AF785A|nr:transmembrane protein 79-like [Ostrea edulis]
MSDKTKDKRTFQEKKAHIIKQIFTSLSVSGTVFVLSYKFLPINTSNVTELTERLAFTICCLFVSSFSIIMGIRAVGNVRRNTDAIDPVYGGGENLVDVPNRILRNTTEQFFLHMMAMLTLTLFLEGSSMKAIPILSGIFLTARIVFQYGYMSSPMNRAYGFASTFIPTLLTYVYCTFCIVRKIIGAY